MYHKIFYGAGPKLADRDKPMFSRNGYQCDTLLQNCKGKPVVISRSTDSGPVITTFPVSCSGAARRPWPAVRAVSSIWRAGRS